MYQNKNSLRQDSRYISDYSHIAGITILPLPEVVGNIFRNSKAPKRISFSLQSDNPVKLEYILHLPDYLQKMLYSEIISGTSEICVQLPELSESYGVFRLQINGYSLPENEFLGSDNISFSHIRAGKGSFQKCGVCTHILRHDAPESRECIKLISELGCRMMRDDLLWNECETEKDEITIPECYENIINALVAEGITPNLIFAYGNCFHDEATAPRTAEGRRAYAHFCSKAAEHFKGRVKHYEIWNEYNLGGGGFNPTSETPEMYAEMLKVVYPALKAVDPDIVITAGVTCGTHLEWLNRILKAGAYDYFDQVSLHPYCAIPDGTYPDDGQGQAEANTKAFSELIQKYGARKPVWISEIGWTTNAADGACSRKDQAAYLTRLFAITEAGNIIHKVTMYDFCDDGRDSFEMEHHWGMVESGASKVPFAAKESYAAVSLLNTMIAGKTNYKKDIFEKIKIVHFSDSTDTVYMLWSLDGVKTLVAAADRALILTDLYGNEQQLVPCKGVVQFTVSENPCYITGGKITPISVHSVEYKNEDDPYTVSLYPEKRADGWYLNAGVNSWSYSLAGRIRLEIPELDLNCNYSCFDLNKAEKHTVTLKVGDIDYKKSYQVLVDLNFVDGVRCIKKETVSFLEASQRKNAAQPIILEAPLNYKSISDTPVPQLKAEITLTYDQNYFYLDGFIHDETHLQTGTTEKCWQDIWDGDYIELILQPLYDGNKDITRYSDIGLALTSNTNESIAWRWRTLSNRSYGRFRTCKFNADRHDGVTEYHAQFPWEELLPPALTYQDCDSFGFALRVGYANSNQHSLDGYLQLYGGIGSWRAPLSYLPQEFGSFILEK